MAYDEGIAERIRYAVADTPNVTEKKMFGGIAFLVNGHMCCGVTNETLMVRVGADNYESALARPHARTMDFTGKPLRGFVYVATAGFDTDDGLESWIRLGLDFVTTLPPK